MHFYMCFNNSLRSDVTSLQCPQQVLVVHAHTRTFVVDAAGDLTVGLLHHEFNVIGSQGHAELAHRRAQLFWLDEAVLVLVENLRVRMRKNHTR